MSNCPITESVDGRTECGIWLDVQSPSEDECNHLAEQFGEAIPSMDDIAEFEASSRFFMSKNAVHLRAFFLTIEESSLDTAAIGFLVAEDHLITVHWSPLAIVAQYQQRLCATGDVGDDPWNVVLGLFEAHIDSVADEMESLYGRVDEQNTLLSKDIDDLSVLISSLGRIEEQNEKIRFSLMDQQQTLANLSRHKLLHNDLRQRLTELLADIRSLIDHSDGVLNRISLHSTLVMSRAQLEDSKITKVFSVIAALFLPPDPNCQHLRHEF